MRDLAKRLSQNKTSTSRCSSGTHVNKRYDMSLAEKVASVLPKVRKEGDWYRCRVLTIRGGTTIAHSVMVITARSRRSVIARAVRTKTLWMGFGSSAPRSPSEYGV